MGSIKKQPGSVNFQNSLTIKDLRLDVSCYFWLLWRSKYILNIFATLIAKSFVSFIIFGTYMQVTHTYDITGKVKTLARNRKLVQKNKQ